MQSGLVWPSEKKPYWLKRKRTKHLHWNYCDLLRCLSCPCSFSLYWYFLLTPDLTLYVCLFLWLNYYDLIYCNRETVGWESMCWTSDKRAHTGKRHLFSSAPFLRNSQWFFFFWSYFNVLWPRIEQLPKWGEWSIQGKLVFDIPSNWIFMVGLIIGTGSKWLYSFPVSSSDFSCLIYA